MNDLHLLKVISIEEAQKLGSVKSKSILKVIKRDGCACKHCNGIAIDMRFYFDHKYACNLVRVYGIDTNFNYVQFTVDHIKPKSKGGANNMSNYQLLCYKCNQKKGNKPDIKVKKNDTNTNSK